jgi:hypothetical protein
MGPSCAEVYEYDLEAESLHCVSCNPSGLRPLGPSTLSLIRSVLGKAPGAAFPQPENLPAQGEGRLFFNSLDVLSPKDTNGHLQDVYEWMPSGVSGCARAQGCLSLISSGHSANDTTFMTATPDASNAFFVTREQLLPQDHDELLDVYDARVGGGIAEGGVPPCSGETCRGSLSSPPSLPGAGSSFFSGLGNLTPLNGSAATVHPKPLTRAQKLARALRACAKKPKRKRRACRAQAERRYGHGKVRAKAKSHKGAK